MSILNSYSGHSDTERKDFVSRVLQIDDNPPNPGGPEREIVFLEDSQMYYTTPVIFRTNYPGTIKQLEDISPSGQFSDTFNAFQKRLVDAGYTATFVERLEKKASVPEKYRHLVIRGGEGTY